MKQVYLILALLGLSVHFSNAQNLIPNNSFEKIDNSGKSKELWMFMNEWKWMPGIRLYDSIYNKQILLNTERYKHEGITYTVKPVDGEYFVQSNNAIEVNLLQVKLKEKLKKGSHYTLNLWYRAYSPTGEAIKLKSGNFGLSFHNEDNYNDEDKQKAMENRIRIRKNNIVFEPDLLILPPDSLFMYEWVEYKADYIAKDSSEYLLIGNHKIFDLKNKQQTKDLSRTQVAYSLIFCIDNISLEKRKNILDYSSIKPVIVEDIRFETGSYILKSSSYNVLNIITEELKQNPDIRIKVSGYTDNIGSEESNLKLSDNRAKAVVDYIVSKGISKDRLISKGYGSQNPVTDNQTKDGRSKNRRVELNIIK